MSNDKKSRFSTFVIQSGVSAANLEPFISITAGEQDFHTQLSPEDTIDLAHKLIRMAEEAKADAFVFQFMLDIDAEPKDAFAFMAQFREWRERRKMKGLPTHA